MKQWKVVYNINTPEAWNHGIRAAYQRLAETNQLQDKIQ